MKKRWIGGAAAAGALLAGAGAVLYASQVERAEVQLDRFTVEVDRPGLPPDGIVVLHLSDFHFRAGGRVQARKIARLKQLLAGERYDIVALTGDLIHDAAGFPAALSLIESLRPQMGAFSCRGNPFSEHLRQQIHIFYKVIVLLYFSHLLLIQSH